MSLVLNIYDFLVQSAAKLRFLMGKIGNFAANGQGKGTQSVANPGEREGFSPSIFRLLSASISLHTPFPDRWGFEPSIDYQ